MKQLTGWQFYLLMFVMLSVFFIPFSIYVKGDTLLAGIAGAIYTFTIGYLFARSRN